MSLLPSDQPKQTTPPRKYSVNYRINANFGCMAAFVATICLVGWALTREVGYLLFVPLCWAVLLFCWFIARSHILGWRKRRNVAEQEERFDRWFHRRGRRTDDL